jgi:hypothetical protein
MTKEVFVFSEGTIWLSTAAGASALMEYVRDVRAELRIGIYKYRPPMTDAYVRQETGRVGTLSFTQAHSQKTALLMFASGTTTVNAHIAGYISGHNYSHNINLWTGALNAGSFSEGEGQDESRISIQGEFDNFGVG